MTAIRAGQLHERARSEGFEGEERGLLEHLNQGLEALTTPLTAATEFLGCLSQGKIPDKITANLAGDLNLTKTNLNACVEALAGLLEVNQAQERVALNDLSLQARRGSSRNLRRSVSGQQCRASPGAERNSDPAKNCLRRF